MNRRAMLKTVAVAGAALALPATVRGQTVAGANRQRAVIRYLEPLVGQRPPAVIVLRTLRSDG